jgi:hypothetical protein
MPRDPSAEAERAVELFGQVIGETIGGTFRLGLWMLGLTASQRDRRRAEQQRAKDERASRRQQQHWYALVERQKARGNAGFASEAEAREALRGRGGRQSNLDDRYF